MRMTGNSKTLFKPAFELISLTVKSRSFAIFLAVDSALIALHVYVATRPWEVPGSPIQYLRLDKELGVSDSEFPDMSLGASENGEMSAQMISSGWRIKLGAAGKTYEYRADKYQLRLHNFNGANHVIEV